MGEYPEGEGEREKGLSLRELSRTFSSWQEMNIINFIHLSQEEICLESVGKRCGS